LWRQRRNARQKKEAANRRAAAEELRESKRREKLKAKEAQRRKRSAVPEWAKVAPPSEPASAEPLSEQMEAMEAWRCGENALFLEPF
jgi:hypothetical protein